MSVAPSPQEALTWDLIDRLAKALRVGRVTKGQMAAHLKVSGNTIGNYLAGRTTPNDATLKVWALRCGVPYGWLIGEESGPDAPSDQGIPPSPCNADTAKVLKFRNAEPTKSARPKAA